MRSRNGNYCPDRTCFGLHGDGGLAVFSVADVSRLWRLEVEMDPTLAVLIEPASIALQALRVLDVKLTGQQVAISGPLINLTCIVQPQQMLAREAFSMLFNRIGSPTNTYSSLFFP